MFAASKTSAAAAGAPPGPSTDPQFNYVTMLLHGDGTNGAQNNTFVSEPVVVPSGVGYLAGLFNGTTDYVSAPYTTPTQFGSGDFTIEGWMYLKDISKNNYLFCQQNSAVNTNADLSVFCAGIASGGFYFGWCSGSSQFNATAPVGSIKINTWHHIACVRSGNSFSVYVDGVVKATTTSAVTVNTLASTPRNGIGAYTSSFGNDFCSGYISNVRVVKGTAVYTSNFSVPTSPLTAISGTSLLTCQSGSGATFADNSTNNFTITRTGTPTMTGVATTPPGAVPYTGSFNGSGQYLTAPNNTAFDFGTGDFTVECWCYFNSLGGANYAPVFANAYLFYVGSSGQVLLFNGSTNVASGPNGAVTTGVWTHLAYARSSGTVRLFVNGVQTGSNATVTASIGSGSPNLVGRHSTVDLNGYLSNLRIVKGTAVYTSNFAPPASPLTAITNTSLLTCQSSTFIDNSPNNFTITNNGSTPVVSSYILPTITRNGTPTQGSFSPYGDLWSNFFASGQFLAMSANTAFVLDGSFTVEAWVCLSAVPALDADSKARGCVLSYYQNTNTSGYQLGVNKTDNLVTFFRNQAGTGIACSYNIQVGVWYHVAVVYNGTTGSIYIDGVAQTTTTNNWSWVAPSTPTLRIGALTQSSYLQYFPGYISNVRIVKGTALYTSNFTPSTTPLTAVSGTSLLTCQSNRFKDNSSNNFAITVTGTPSVQRFSPFDPAAEYSTSVIGGSGYFNGTTDYLSAASNTAFEFGTGQYTVEFWVYFNAIANWNEFVCMSNDTTLGRWTMYYSGGSLQVTKTGGGGTTSASWTPITGRWYHIAVSRDSSNNQKLFIDGVQVGTAVSTNNYTQSGFRFGYTPFVNAPYVNGYVSNIRIVKGTALYTAAFTPPTAPLTAITNTSLLLNCVNAGIYDNAMMNDLVTVGDAQVSTAVKKYGTGSMKFDGSGDWLTYPDTPSTRLGSGDFTIEAWIYLNTVGVSQTIVTKGNTTGFIFWVSGNLRFTYGTSSILIASSLSALQWYHVAVVRSGSATGNLKIYIDGVLAATSSTAVTDDFSQTDPGYVGVGRSGANPMDGYIDDLRITKGIARYTANFTPPTAALPNN